MGIAEAAARAVAALRSTQRPSGELPTYSARRADMADAAPYACSVYTTAFAAHALRRWPDLPAAREALLAAEAHLRAQRNPDGSWSYEGRATTRVPADLDDTACALAALERHAGYALGFFRLLWENEAAPGGPYYTWVGVNDGDHLLARQLDALVNANVVFGAAVAGQRLPGAVAYLLDVTSGGRFDEASVFCFTPHLLLYALARAYADGPVPELAPAVRAGLAVAGACENALQLACVASALLALGERGAAAPHLAALLDAQLPDGSWPIAAAYSGYPPHHDGSPALTTALALDALGRAAPSEHLPVSPPPPLGALGRVGAGVEGGAGGGAVGGEL